MSSTEKPEIGFSILMDQDRPVRVLTAVLSSGNLPHAFLFTGIEGVGKKTAAMAVAMACNCLALDLFPDRLTGRTAEGKGIEPCGECRPCKKIRSGQHPDILIVEPQGDLIKVDQIRALSEKLVLKPYEAAKRVVVIRDAHKFNTEAANTLLKTLEEPPEHTLFILTALQASDMLPTIVSRCQQIRFNPIDGKSLATYLERRYEMAPAEAAAIASMARGSRTNADRMSLVQWASRREWILREMKALPSCSINGCLALAETLSRNKDLVFAVFEIMKNWLRDIILCQHLPDRPEKIINRDFLDQIENAARMNTSDTLMRRFKAIEQAERDIKSNANLRLTLDALILTLCKGS